MSTTLFGKFIANTYQKVLQYDENENYTNIANFDIADLLDSKYTLLNGAGQAVSGIAIDHTDKGDGGLFIKETTIDPTGAWGLQHCYGIGAPSNTDPGIQFWRPYEGNFHLFLKNTGTLFVGYRGDSSVPQDVASYSLYVKNGIQVGTSSNGNNGRINLIGDDPLEDGAGMFINSQHPFYTLRYRYSFQFENDRIRTITDIDNTTTFKVNEWSAHITGFYLRVDDNVIPEHIVCMMVDNGSGEWAVKFNNFSGIGGGAPDKTIIFDVLFLKKGLYVDSRNLDESFIDYPQFGFPNTGSYNDLNPLTPLI